LKRSCVLAASTRISSGLRIRKKEVLIEQGTHPGRMLVLASGQAAVKVHAREVFLTGARTTAAVEVVEPVRFVSWTPEGLERFLGKHPDLRAALQLVLGRDLAAKLVSDRDKA